MVLNIKYLTKYLKNITPVRGYVVAIDGLVVDYYNIDRDSAENLAAWGTELTVKAKEKIGLRGRIANLYKTVDNDIVIFEDSGESVVVVTEPNYGESVAQVLIAQGPKCQVCGQDLSNAIIKCPVCGSKYPYSVAYCKKCGEPLFVRRCPVCGSLIDLNGRKVSFKARFFGKKVDSTFIK